jgi:hypothetical protein
MKLIPSIRFYTDDDMMEYFGTLSPSLEERTELFNKLWNTFGKKNELSLDGCDLSIAKINEIRERFGPFNVVRRGRTLRFKNREDLLLATLCYARINSN